MAWVLNRNFRGLVNCGAFIDGMGYDGYSVEVQRVGITS